MRNLLFILSFIASLSAFANRLDTVQLAKQLDSAYLKIFSEIEVAKEAYKVLGEPIERLEKNYRLKHDLKRGLGIISFFEKEYDQAETYYNEAIILARKLDDKVGLTKCYYNIGLIYLNQNKHFDASENFHKAIFIANEIKLNKMLSNSYNTLGVIFESLEQYEQSTKYYSKALEIAKEEKDTIDMIHYYLNLAIQANSQKNLALSETYLSKAEPLLSKKSTDKVLGMYYQRKAINLNETDHLAALNAILLSIEHIEKTSFNVLKINSNLILSNIYRKLDRLSDSEQVLKKVEKELNWEDSTVELSFKNEYYQSMMKLYEKRKQYNEALYFSKAHQLLDEELVGNKKIRYLALLTARNNQLFQDNEILAHSVKIKEQDDTIRFKSIRAYLILLGLLLSLILFIFLKTLSTSRKRNKYFKKLREHNLQLEKSNKEKSDFIDSISHEFRTPLYTISGISELLKTCDNDKDKDKYLSTLRFSKDYLSNFIDNILFINNDLSNKQLSITPLNLNTLISNILKSINILGSENKMEVTICETIPPLLMGDSKTLNLVLFNLLNNAAKFTKNGLIEVKVTKLNQTNDQVEVQFEVSDTGIGICSSIEEQIYQPFFKGSPGVTNFYDGTGIGLFVVKSILSQYGREIQCKSTLGEGATFSFSMPFQYSKKEALFAY